MDIKTRINLISLVILLVCILAAIVIYQYTGNIIVVIFIAPPIIHWILKKRHESDHF